MSRVIAVYDQWSRMGNRMFIYAFAKILANIKNCEFYCEQLPNFPFTWKEIKLPKNFSLNNPITTRTLYGNHHVNMEHLINYKDDIIVNSFLQKAEYYIPYRANIQQWFNIQIDNANYPEKEEIVAHVRETDYKELGMVLDNEYYFKILKNTQNKVTIMTDNCNSPIMECFKEKGYNIGSTAPVKEFLTFSPDSFMLDYLYMYYADTLILSQSTFCWWAAFLGQHEVVYFPVSSKTKGMWKELPEEDDVNLWVPNSNFTKVVL